MRIFTASWFFPPGTSSEGLVTFKLLKYSRHVYDVCCSASRNWSYDKDSVMTADHIHVYPVRTDSITEWVKACISLFKKLDAQYNYSCVMTRSTPPESILVGLAIKKIRPSIQWIASFADPVYRNPYEMDGLVYRDVWLKKCRLNRFFMKHPGWIPYTIGCLPAAGYQLLKRLYFMEKCAVEQADRIIVPSKKQLAYLLELKSNRRYADKCCVIMHSYDPAMYPQAGGIHEKQSENMRLQTGGMQALCHRQSKKTTITYVGYLDEKRMPYDLLAALHHLKKLCADSIKDLNIQFVGNIDSRLMDAANAFFLGGIIEQKKPVSYAESLRIMQEADYLLHIDADFEFLTGGSIFCASKIMDYIGSGNRVLALTNPDSEAARIVRSSGGIILERGHVMQIAESIIDLLKQAGCSPQCIQKAAADQAQVQCRKRYCAQNTAAQFDHMLQQYTERR